jgi:drug/metabolite transporter (DMT)-like permease
MTHLQAMLCAFLAFFVWVFMDVAVKLASQTVPSPFMVITILGLVGIAYLVAAAFSNRDFTVLRPRHWREQALVSFCGTASLFANVIALKHLPLTIFYIVVFTAPLAIASVAALFKQEKLTGVKITCVITGFVGVVIAIWPSLAPGGEWIGYAAGMASVLGFAFYTVTIRKIAHTDTVQSIQLSGSVTLTVAGILGWLPTAELPSVKMLAVMIFAGMANFLGNILYNKSLQYTSSTNVAQLHYTQIISGALFGYFIWGEVPTGYLVAGGILIIASGMVVAAQAHKRETAIANVPP